MYRLLFKVQTVRPRSAFLQNVISSPFVKAYAVKALATTEAIARYTDGAMP